MTFNTLRNWLRPALLVLPVIVLTYGASATPSQADPYCYFSWCNTPPPAEEVEPTGVVHTIYLVGDTFFPDRVRANLGDEIMFHNLRNGAMRVQARDNSWVSDSINKNFNWSFIVQEDTELEFQKWSYYGYSSMRGRIELAGAPTHQNYGDLIDYEGNIVGKDGTVIKTADGLGYSLAGLSGTLRQVGGGLAKGLTSSYGLGNN